MKFIHYGKKPLTKVRSVKNLGYGAGRTDKPMGLWFSAGDGEDGWRAWCEGEQWGLDGFDHATEIVFRDSAKLLRISSTKELDAFTEANGFDCDYMPKHLSYGKGYGIRWPEIAKAHDAIVIAPYLWERRLFHGAHWYYSWDCASGCVWNARAVAELRPLEVPALKAVA